MRFGYLRAAARRKRACLTKENLFVNRRMLRPISRVTRMSDQMARSLIAPSDSRMSREMLGWRTARPMASTTPGLLARGAGRSEFKQ